MHSITEIAGNRIFWCAILAWFIAQALKIPTYWFVEKKLNWRRIRGAGGMPSSHTSFVVALTIMVGCLEGFDTAAFAISFTLAAIVMYDATGVRRETGNQAQVINEILKNVFVNGKPISEEYLKELIGHKPIEVLCGALVGVLTAAVFLIFL